jgi:uncharacterized protein YajQ (UPF0234 family)
MRSLTNVAQTTKPTAEKCLETAKAPVVREYDIGGTKYIVTATVKAGVNEDAAAKVRRLIRKEINGKAEK